MRYGLCKMDQCTNVKHSVVVLLVLNVIMFQITLSNTDDSHTIVQHTATCVRDVTNCNNIIPTAQHYKTLEHLTLNTVKYNKK